MRLLSEIYALDKLKLNLKFEIEMLFKDLALQIPEVPPSAQLKGIEREVGPSNPDFSIDKDGDLFLVGRVSLDEWSPGALDTVLGTIYEAVELSFKSLIRIGFQQ